MALGGVGPSDLMGVLGAVVAFAPSGEEAAFAFGFALGLVNGVDLCGVQLISNNGGCLIEVDHYGVEEQCCLLWTHIHHRNLVALRLIKPTSSGRLELFKLPLNFGQTSLRSEPPFDSGTDFQTETEPLLYPILTTQLNMLHDPNGPSERKRINIGRSA